MTDASEFRVRDHSGEQAFVVGEGRNLVEARLSERWIKTTSPVEIEQ